MWRAEFVDNTEAEEVISLNSAPAPLDLKTLPELGKLLLGCHTSCHSCYLRAQGEAAGERAEEQEPGHLAEEAVGRLPGDQRVSVVIRTNISTEHPQVGSKSAHSFGQVNFTPLSRISGI